MNALKTIQSSSKLARDLKPHLIIYLYLLSRASGDSEGNLHSHYSPHGIEREFAQFDVASCLEELENIGYIQIDEDENICVGEKILDTWVLFSNVSDGDDLVDVFAELWIAWDAYEQECKVGGRIAPANNCKAVFNELRVKDSHHWTNTDFRNFFRTVYEVIHQEKYREFLVKDHTQLKKLLQIYDKPVLVRMVVYFMQHYNIMGKKMLADVGNLLFYKDEVFARVTSKKLTKRRYEPTSKKRFK